VTDGRRPLELLAAAGRRFEAGERALYVPCENAPVDLLLVRPHDIPEYVQDSVVHVGITGANLVVRGGGGRAHAGRARLRFVHPRGGLCRRMRPRSRSRISPGCASRTRIRLRPARRSRAQVSRWSSCRSPGPSRRRRGSVLSDAVVDLVSTGSTASVNGLRRIGTLLRSEAVADRQRRTELVDRLELMIRGVVAARRRRYLMLNAPEEALPRIRELLPGLGARPCCPSPRRARSPFTPAVDAD